MSSRIIHLPAYKSPLFNDFSQELSRKNVNRISLNAKLLKNTNHYIEIIKSTDDSMYLLIKTPNGETCKTVIVKRELDSKNMLTLNVSHYGTLCNNHIDALGQCARRFGCNRVLLNEDSINEFLNNKTLEYM